MRGEIPKLVLPETTLGEAAQDKNETSGVDVAAHEKFENRI